MYHQHQTALAFILEAAVHFEGPQVPSPPSPSTLHLELARIDVITKPAHSRLPLLPLLSSLDHPMLRASFSLRLVQRVSSRAIATQITAVRRFNSQIPAQSDWTPLRAGLVLRAIYKRSSTLLQGYYSRDCSS